MPPPLLNLPNAAAYRRHYIETYCRSVIFAGGGIRVFFRQPKFDHAFSTAPEQGRAKRAFSSIRAERMDWINPTLTDPASSHYQGWSAKDHSHNSSRAVYHLYESFVVVVQFRLTQTGNLKANFVTCYEADRSIGKIKESPLWTQQDCLDFLIKNGR